MPKPNLRNMANKGVNIMKAAVGITTPQTKYTTFVALGELTDNKLTRIRGVAERSDLNNSSLATNGYTLAQIKDINQTGQADGYTFFKADDDKEFKEIKEKSTLSKVANFLSSAASRATGNTRVPPPDPLQNPISNPLKKPGGSRTSKKTQRRRQKRQNRKTRHI